VALSPFRTRRRAGSGDHVFIVRTAVTGFPDTETRKRTERRALNVSMTRAKVGLYLVYPRQVPFCPEWLACAR